MVGNLKILQEFIERNSTTREEHKIWNGALTNSLTIESIKAMTKLSKKSYRPCELFWIVENQKEMLSNTRLERTCQTKNCISHYDAIQYNLDSIVEMDENTYMKTCERFDKHCEEDSETGCINWNASIFGITGYGEFQFLGKQQFAHRVAYILANCEDIPANMFILHSCPKKNKLCVNPDHLRVGTPQQNSQDEIDGGHTRQGEKHPNATISNEIAQMIINSFGNKKSIKERANEFGVSRKIVESIDAAKHWRHLMTPKQILERESVKRRKQTLEVLSDDIIFKIKNSNESQKKCAKTFNTTRSIVKKIKIGKYKSSSERDEVVFQETIERLGKYSTKFKDPTIGIEHMLFKNDKSQDPKARRYKISYFNIPVCVARASYMAHKKIKSIEQGKVVRHKCLYKHCVSNECLELGTVQDNANDRKRDNTSKKGEQHPNVKITQQIAIQVKQTKGIGTQKQRSEFFNVPIGSINNIDNYKSWTHLEDDTIDQEVIDKLEEYVTNQPRKKRVRLF